MLMHGAQWQATNGLDALVAQLLRGRKARVLIEVANDERLLLAPDEAVDRVVDCHLGGLNVGPAFVAAFEKIRAHDVALLVVQHHGEIAKRRSEERRVGKECRSRW